MEQGRIRGALIEREERDVGDAREPLECATDLTAGIDAERTGPDLVDDHDDGRGRCQSPQLRVITEEPADAQRVGGGERDDHVCLTQGRRRRGVPARARQIVRDLVVRIEGSGHIDDGLLDPLSAGAQRCPQP